MNVREWLHSRTPRPPLALTDRLDVLLARDDANATSVPDALQMAADHLLADLLRRQAASRDSALDLLAADALMTYMMESAAEHVVTLGSYAEVAMSRISRTLDESSPAA
jgi:hypothetical protein